MAFTTEKMRKGKRRSPEMVVGVEGLERLVGDSRGAGREGGERPDGGSVTDGWDSMLSEGMSVERIASGG